MIWSVILWCFSILPLLCSLCSYQIWEEMPFSFIVIFLLGASGPLQFPKKKNKLVEVTCYMCVNSVIFARKLGFLIWCDARIISLISYFRWYMQITKPQLLEKLTKIILPKKIGSRQILTFFVFYVFSILPLPFPLFLLPSLSGNPSPTSSSLSIFSLFLLQALLFHVSFCTFITYLTAFNLFFLFSIIHNFTINCV